MKEFEDIGSAALMPAVALFPAACPSPAGSDDEDTGPPADEEA